MRCVRYSALARTLLAFGTMLAAYSPKACALSMLIPSFRIPFSSRIVMALAGRAPIDAIYDPSKQDTAQAITGKSVF